LTLIRLASRRLLIAVLASTAFVPTVAACRTGDPDPAAPARCFDRPLPRHASVADRQADTVQVSQDGNETVVGDPQLSPEIQTILDGATVQVSATDRSGTKDKQGGSGFLTRTPTANWWR